MTDWKCKRDTKECRKKCNNIGGSFDNEECNALKIISKVCVKVELEYINGLPAEEAEVVSGMKFKGGCFSNGETV